MQAATGSSSNLNRSAGRLTIGELFRRISALPDVVIQSIFVHGPVDNTKPGEIKLWARWLERIRPVSVQIYSLDRPPAKSWVRAVSRKELEWIAEYLESTTGIPAHVF